MREATDCRDIGPYQASFRLRHERPYRELSERFPALTIREWYLSNCQVLEFSFRDAPSEEFVEEIDQLGTILHRSSGESGLHVVTQTCLRSVENSIIDRFEEYNCLYQPPTVHQQGWEQYRLIAFDEADIRSLHEDLESDRAIEVLSKTGLEEARIPHSLPTPVDQLFSELTGRQLAPLQLALENGYYEQPRNRSVSDLAEQTTVARATFEEHLRKAENKLIKNAGRFIRLLNESRTGEGLRDETDSPIVGRT